MYLQIHTHSILYGLLRHTDQQFHNVAPGDVSNLRQDISGFQQIRNVWHSKINDYYYYLINDCIVFNKFNS